MNDTKTIYEMSMPELVKAHTELMSAYEIAYSLGQGHSTSIYSALRMVQEEINTRLAEILL